MILVSYRQAWEILEQLKYAPIARTSLDLGRTGRDIAPCEGGVDLGGGQVVSMEDLRKVAKCEDAVFFVQEGRARKLILFSEQTGLTYKLRPTQDWPALEISGILMHRIKDTTPLKDAQAKLKLLGARGSVLDTCMGLGYTAILAAATADAVTVIEKDANVIEMARLNPYSHELFTQPKIKLVHADASEAVPSMPDAAFDIVNHDPPTLSVAGELYSDAFYMHLLRILKPGGRLLHYTGAPGSRTGRMDLQSSVARRLTAAGFAQVRNDPATFCTLAARPGRPKSGNLR